MSLLVVIPVRDQLERIEPLINSLKLLFNEDIDEILFTLERSHKQTYDFIEYISQKYELSKYSSKEVNIKNRFLSLQASIDTAQDKNLKYIMILNEGWEDNIHEFINIVKNKEYLKYDAIIGRRTPTELSLGTILNSLSNMLSSLFLKRPILETKCDSINIYKANSLIRLKSVSKKENLFYFEILYALLKTGKVKFSDVDFGLNYPSIIKLNTKRFFDLVFYLLFSKV